MEILFYTDMHLNGAFRLYDADGVGMHGAMALPMLQAILDYAEAQKIGHVINGGDSVNFNKDTQAYRRDTQDFDRLAATFTGSSSSSLGNHDFHDLLQAFISATVAPSNVKHLGPIDLLTLQPTAKQDPKLSLNFDYDWDEFTALVEQSTSDHLAISSHWSFERDTRIRLKQKSYAFTRSTSRFRTLLEDQGVAGRKIINLSGHEHSFYYADDAYKTLVMPSAIQSDIASPADPSGLFAILKIGDDGEFSVGYKRVVMGQKWTPPGQPISVEVVDVDTTYMNQYSRKALGRIRHDDPRP